MRTVPDAASARQGNLRCRGAQARRLDCPPRVGRTVAVQKNMNIRTKMENEMTVNTNTMTKAEIVTEYELLQLERDDLQHELDEAKAFIADMNEGNPAKHLRFHFDVPGKVWDRDLRREVDGNTMGFVQQFVLNGYLNQLCFSRERFERFLDDRRANAKRAIEMSRGDEIGLRKAQTAVEMVEQKVSEISLIDQLIAEGSKEYFEITGEEWKPHEQNQSRATPAPKTSREDLLAQAAALGIETDVEVEVQTANGNTNEVMQPA